MHQKGFRPSASFWEAGRIAIDSLRKNKLRSFLTLLGIILATSTLIAVTAFIHGMNVYIATKLSDMGSDGFRVVRIAMIGHWDPKKFLEMQRRNPQLKPEEYDFVRTNAHLLQDIGLQAWRSESVGYKGQFMQGVDMQGMTANVLALNNVEVSLGRAFTEQEVRRHSRVTFIGTEVSDHFFPGVDPVGKTITIGGVPYEVVGVAKAKGSVFGQSQDKFVDIPIYFVYEDLRPQQRKRLCGQSDRPPTHERSGRRSTVIAARLSALKAV